MAHTADHHAAEERRYLIVFAWLAILTAFEIGVIYLPIPHTVIAGILVLLAGTKATLVALFYMHLAYEKNTLMWIALTPMILCTFLLLMLMPDHLHFTRMLTHATPTAATEEAHH
jgi:caa(3)-type oxidase subunit IV